MNIEAHFGGNYGLGDLLGLVSTRPDSAGGDRTGPDVLWRYPEASEGVALELKTDKKVMAKYTKKEDIGQFQDHVNYLRKNHPKEEFRQRIVGPRLAVAEECNPPVELRISEVAQFRQLAVRLGSLYEFLNAAGGTEQRAVTVERWLKQLGLQWPRVIDALEAELATDLQSLPPD